MRALVNGEGFGHGTFNESPEEHLARCHPDLAAAQEERQALEAALIERAQQNLQRDPPAVI